MVDTPELPLATWSDDQSSHPRLVWWARLDDRWQIEVQRLADYQGVLLIFDHANAMTLAYREPVGLSYGAVFGPDVGDVAFWQDQAMAYVDALPAEG